jgi:hypothetical protein
MRTPFALRLPPLTGLGMALVVALLYVGRCEVQAAQSSFGNIDTPQAGTPVAPPWPMVGWGIEPVFPGNEKHEWIAGLQNDAGPAVLSLRSEGGDVSMNIAAGQDLDLGPVVSVVAPPMGENATGSGQTAGPIRLGNVTFNQTADSLNVWSSGSGKAGDLSRQFEMATTDRNVVQSSPISGWAIAALAGLAVIIAMAIAYYENDRDDRKRRRSSGRGRRRHHRTS